MKPTDITATQIAAAQRLAGRPRTTDAHRKLLLKSLPKMRERLQVLRVSPLAEGMPMATPFLPLPPAAAPVATQSSVSVLTDAGARTWDGTVESLAFAPITLLATLLQTRRVTSRQLTEFFLDRLKRFGPDLHCVVNLVPDKVALREADAADAEIAFGKYRGPLHGIPYGAKDLFTTKGLPTTDGVKPYQKRKIESDAEVITRLRNAGAILVAKLSLGELMMDDIWFGGKTRNPWDTEAGSSGSSAGSASAVAAGLVPFALGTETWGSIISPCNVCGTAGLRPTFGRVPRTGASALSWSMDKIGPIGRRAADNALIFDSLHGADAQDNACFTAPFHCDLMTPDLQELRIGYDVAGWKELAEKHPTLLSLFDSAKAVVEEKAGKPLIPVHLPEMTPDYEALPMLIIGVEGAASYAALIASGGMEKLVQQDEDNWPNIFRTAQTVPATEYVQAQRVRSHLQHAMQSALSEVDVYLTPPCIGPSLLYTNLTGHPEVITRCGFTEGNTPAMLSFVSSLHREDAALRVAHVYEQSTPWHRRTPPGF